jgi:hypothetical protein
MFDQSPDFVEVSNTNGRVGWIELGWFSSCMYPPVGNLRAGDLNEALIYGNH